MGLSESHRSRGLRAGETTFSSLLEPDEVSSWRGPFSFQVPSAFLAWIIVRSHQSPAYPTAPKAGPPDSALAGLSVAASFKFTLEGSTESKSGSPA